MKQLSPPGLCVSCGAFVNVVTVVVVVYSIVIRFNVER